DGQPNVRTCVTPVRAGMKVETQIGLGRWAEQA
ncbi:MAG: 2Fe-2S iron-sulfur cluster-binding protein, partial [Peptococcaceae bacterium]|nr:2Fe-2S iron-sulfur cluster-binding protein [Peptococcaceae bacterium]